MEKSLESKVRSREFNFSEIITENLKEILNSISQNNNSFYNPRSRTQRSYVKSIIYGSINKDEIKMLDLQEYLKMGKPDTFYHPVVKKSLKLSGIIVSTPYSYDSEIKYLLKGGYKN